MRIRELKIYSSDKNHTKVNITNCKIGRLIIHRNPNNRTFTGTFDLFITGCDIGELEIAEETVSRLHMVKGSSSYFRIPSPSSKNPFLGSVDFINVNFAKKTRNELLEGAQSYRNLRYHLRDLENLTMANKIHALELKIERETDTWFNKLLNIFYQVFSNYGSSAWLPILWILVLAFITFSWSYLSDGAMPVSRTPILGDWREMLYAGGNGGNFNRSLILSVQPIISPLSIFGTKSSVLPKEAWVAVWVVFQSYLSLILVALSIFSIRRRFKLK